MKVALCYRGHYFRIEGKGRRSKSSSFFLNYQNHKTNIIDCFENVDVYFHTYTPKEHCNSYLDVEQSKSELISLLNPVQYKIESEDTIEIRHSIVEVNKMYNQSDYDLVINTRFDLRFKHKITEFDIDSNKFNFLWREEYKSRRHVHAFDINFRCSDLLWVFNPKFQTQFNNSFGSEMDDFFGEHNMVRDGHSQLYFLSKQICEQTDVNFMVKEYYLSGMQKPNPHIDINRSYQ